MHVVQLEEELKSNILIGLYVNVSNLESLKSQIENGELECCILRPALIVSTLQIALAANRAQERKITGKLITKSVYTELIYNLSPSKNITESLKTFAAQPTDTCCLVVTFSNNKNPEVKGDLLDISQLPTLTDEQQVRKSYQITEKETSVSSIEDSVLTRIAVKNVQ